jgi:hypothetical protein
MRFSRLIDITFRNTHSKPDHKCLRGVADYPQTQIITMLCGHFIIPTLVADLGISANDNDALMEVLSKFSFCLDLNSGIMILRGTSGKTSHIISQTIYWCDKETLALRMCLPARMGDS